MTNKKQLTTSTVILVATALLIITAVYISNSQKQPTENDRTTNRQNSSEEHAIQKTPSTFKDGTYDTVGSYQSPGGLEKIAVTLTLKGGVVTDTSVQSKAISSDGEKFQKRFISGYKTEVVGKKLDDINLSQVSGSSLTPNGFNDAVKDIQQQAKA